MQWSESAQSPWPGSCTKHRFRGDVRRMDVQFSTPVLEFQIIKVESAESLLHSQGQFGIVFWFVCFSHLWSASAMSQHYGDLDLQAPNGTSGMVWRHIKKRKYMLAGFENLSHKEIRRGLKTSCQTLWIFWLFFFFRFGIRVDGRCGFQQQVQSFATSSCEACDVKKLHMFTSVAVWR